MSDALYSSLIFALPFQGADGATSCEDLSPYRHTVAFTGDAAIDTDYDFFGASSLKLPGSTGDVQISGGAELALGSNDFTLEYRVKTTATNSYACHVCRPSASGFSAGSWAVLMNPGAANGRLQVWVADYSTGSPLLSMTSGTVADGNPHAVRWERSGSTHRLIVDGAVVATATWSGSISSTPTRPIYIANDPNYAGRRLAGYIGEARLTLAARDSGAYTPPTASFAGQISGNIKDSSGANAQRAVRAIPRDGSHVYVATSDVSTGNYTLGPVYDTPHVVVALDDDAGTDFNDLVLGRVSPALYT